MAIKMFDCGFGDCFCISEEHVTRPLYVDFGIYKDSLGSNIYDRYEEILSEMNLHKNKDFLLSHYHDDHYSGLMYMIETLSVPQVRFDTVYIPDVWSYNSSGELAVLLLLSDIFCRYGSKSRMCIIEFLLYICKTRSTVYLTSRGTEIEDNLVALWPDKEKIKTSGLKLFKSLKLEDNDGGVLLSAASKLTRAVMYMVEGQYQEASSILDAVDQEITMLDRDKLYDSVKSKKQALNRFGNKVSIVFHNKVENSNCRNVLFTGDVNKSAWRQIERKTVPLELRMHEKYDVIKIPHHGTKRYYHSFANYNRVGNLSTYMIPNGDIPRCPIYNLKYRVDADNVNVISSNNTSCLVWPSTVGAGRNTVAPKVYETI